MTAVVARRPRGGRARERAAAPDRRAAGARRRAHRPREPPPVPRRRSRPRSPAPSGSAAPLALVLADLDDFKAVNDRHGHRRATASCASSPRCSARRVRDIDLAGRWGGEEFVLILPGHRRSTAPRSVAERVRAALAERVDPVGPTASRSARHGELRRRAATERLDDGAELFARRRRGALRAKRAGKDRVVRCDRAVRSV